MYNVFWFKTPDHRRKATQIRDSDDKDVEYKGHFCSESALFLLLVVCVGGFVGLGVTGYAKLDLGVRADSEDYD